MQTLTMLLRRPPIAAAITWLLPPALAIAAIGLYFQLISPPNHHPWYTPPPPKPGQSLSARALRKGRSVEADVYYRMRASEMNAKTSAARAPGTRSATPKRGAAAEVGADKSDDPGGAAPTPTPNPIAAAPQTTPRAPATVETLWRRLHEQPIDDEPIDAAWAQAHQGLVFAVVSRSREVAFAGAPDPIDVNVVDVTCHTVRCAAVLSARYPHELSLLADAVARVRWGRRSLWREFNVDAASEDTDDDGARRHQLTVTFAFTADLPPIDALTLDARSLAGERAPTAMSSPILTPK
ncbi:MAG: hypothetical protein R3B09_33600 [Nannocystaceae bacterium]